MGALALWRLGCQHHESALRVTAADTSKKGLFMKLRALSAAVAVTVVLGVGVSSVAGAAPSGKHHGYRARIEAIAAAGQLPAKFECSKAPKALSHISSTEAKVNKRISKAQAKLAAATQAGDTTKAQAIAARIAAAQKFETALGTVASLITAKCPS